MKVLMTTDTVGGVWTYSLQLAHALSRYGVAVDLASMGRIPSTRQREEARSVPGLRLFESAYKLEWMEEPWDDVARAGDWLLDLERQGRPDVVHLNNYAHGALPWQAPAVVVGHSCVLSWWEAVRGEAAPSSYARYREEVVRGLRAAGMVVAPTYAMLDALHRHYGPLTSSRVVHNGRDPVRFRPGDKGEFVLAVGRLWDEAKNIGALGRVAPALPWPVYVAGEERHPDGNGTVSLNGVTLLGFLSEPELAGGLSRAPIYALPARYEPFGLSVLEAALSGCALVLGDIASLRELWHGAALFVAPGDDAALERALTSLMAGEVARRELGEKARRRGMRFTPDRMALGYLSAYREVLGTYIPVYEHASTSFA